MNAKLVDLDAMIAELSGPEILETAKDLMSIAAHCALIGQYLDDRESGRTHEQAKKHANATRRIVRRRFGYKTTPDINF